MAVSVKAWVMACHVHVCGVQASEKEKWAVFSPREEQELSLKSASSLLLLLWDVFFFACWRRQRSHGKASSSYLSRGAGSWQGLGRVRGLMSFNTSLVAHLSHGRTVKQQAGSAECASSGTCCLQEHAGTRLQRLKHQNALHPKT